MIGNTYSSGKLKITKIIQRKTDLENYYQEDEHEQNINLVDRKENISVSEQHEPK